MFVGVLLEPHKCDKLLKSVDHTDLLLSIKNVKNHIISSNLSLIDSLGVSEQYLKILHFDPKTPLHSNFTTS